MNRSAPTYISTPFGPVREPVSVHDIDLDEFPGCELCDSQGSLPDGSRCDGCGGVGVVVPRRPSWESAR